MLKKLQQEVDPLIESREFNPSITNPVLDSVIFESIRLQPLVPNGGERVTPAEGLFVVDRCVPGNTVIRVPIYSMFCGKSGLRC